jgi:DnaJ-class molecular chaperone
MAAAVALLVTGTGVATALDNTRYSLTFDKEVVATCAGGEEITLYFDVTVNRHVRYDENGESRWESRNVNYDGYFTNEASGEVIEFTGTRNVTIDLDADTFTSRGKYRVVTLPGMGTVMHETGRYIEGWTDGQRIFESGPKISENPDDPATFALTCSLFGLDA